MPLMGWLHSTGINGMCEALEQVPLRLRPQGNRLHEHR